MHCEIVISPKKGKKPKYTTFLNYNYLLVVQIWWPWPISCTISKWYDAMSKITYIVYSRNITYVFTLSKFFNLRHITQVLHFSQCTLTTANAIPVFTFYLFAHFPVSIALLTVATHARKMKHMSICLINFYNVRWIIRRNAITYVLHHQN